MKRDRKTYPSDLTDEQWEIIKPHFKGMRNRKWDKRELVNAVLYFEKTGCQWRLLPNDFPPFATVWSFYRRAKQTGLWERILQDLVEKIRLRAGAKRPRAMGSLTLKA
ncbi:MAG: transposase [Roseburia sp.]